MEMRTAGRGRGSGEVHNSTGPACMWGERVLFWGPWSGACMLPPVYPHLPVDFSILSQVPRLVALALSPRLTCDTGAGGLCKMV